jgi:uncharacterized protein (DUF1697 family)
MKRYVVLLRAVNVGRTGRVDMLSFCRACIDAGFADTESYLNSGNIILSSDLEREDLIARLGQILEADFRLSPNRVALRTTVELQALFNQNPFSERSRNMPKDVHVHFLLGEPRTDADLMLTSFKGPERLRRVGANVYIDYTKGFADSALTSAFLEKALGVPGTSRNWNTCQHLLQLAQAPG